MRDETVDLPLDGLALTDCRTGEPVHLGEPAGVRVLTLIRHRY
ncbi:MAG TPA: hypothetical protein VD813_07450 [Pseudonocardia sp.]|nr:hypothetical protein [Pseudonocardia sp.]